MSRSDDSTADLCAATIMAAFTAYHVRFKDYSRRSKKRFETHNWAGIQRDARERLDIYSIELRHGLDGLERILGDRIRDTEIWRKIKVAYTLRASKRGDCELAETFLNSVTRRVFTTVGVNPEIEFVATGPRPLPVAGSAIVRSFEFRDSTKATLARVLEAFPFQAPYRDFDGNLDAVAGRIDSILRAIGAGAVDGIDIARSLFFRNKGAYIVGRIRTASASFPLVLPLLHDQRGIVIDAVLIDRDAVSIVFSFTRSYFHVETEHPSELVAFLKAILPHKPVAELYTAIGYNKHGKTELYRNLLRHLETTGDKFELAPGIKGMVMSVFTLPSLDIVLKVIRDRFDFPKTATRAWVLSRYNLVFKHDRVGRLVDTQEFEYLTFDRQRFSEDVLRDLTLTAPSTIDVTDDEIVLKHLYTERRLTPLNLFLQTASIDAACDAVVDYGNCIKDLAAANIFPGDMLLKNFGVTRNGRVAFYDYDEVGLLTDCNFRRIPEARFDEDDLSDEPWFAVRENDVFPEEFPRFLGLDGILRKTFEDAHGDLFDVEFWQSMQLRLRKGELADFFPYKSAYRLMR